MSGIVDLAVRHPEGRMDVHRMHAASGVPEAEIRAIIHSEHFPVLGDGETSWELARDAAQTVLERSSVSLGEIRHVIYAGSGHWDRPFWSPAAKVAHQLGIDWAHCFEVANFCNAGTTALRVAADRLDLAGDGYALVLIGDRLSRMVDYSDSVSKGLFNFGDSAAAVLLEPGPGTFTLLHSAMRTDPSWCDYYQGEYRAGRVVICRSARRSGLASAYVENFTALVDECLHAIGAERTDVTYLLINHGDRGMHERLLRELSLPTERTVFNYDRFGHMGAADTFIALRELVDQRRLRRSDLILLATSAMGFSWGVTALECQL